VLHAALSSIERHGCQVRQFQCRTPRERCHELASSG
jgi:hypothetical protein